MSKARSTTDLLAVLIDAENASPRLIEALLKEVAKYGTASVKRIYGDWTKPNLGSWKEKLNQFAIQPIQQFRYTTGKNSSDSALIIDAMDLLHSRHYDGFCLVSSDSDFTRLACRIREAGLRVYGFGERKTPEAFVKACDKFIYTEILDQTGSADEAPDETHAARSLIKPDVLPKPGEIISAPAPHPIHTNAELQTLLKTAYEAVAGEDGWANLGSLGDQLTKLSPAFDARNYGYPKLGVMIEKSGLFDIKQVATKKAPLAKSWYIKLKPESPANAVPTAV